MSILTDKEVADLVTENNVLKAKLKIAQHSPCEWCVSTTEALDSQAYEIETLKRKIA